MFSHISQSLVMGCSLKETQPWGRLRSPKLRARSLEGTWVSLLSAARDECIKPEERVLVKGYCIHYKVLHDVILHMTELISSLATLASLLVAETARHALLSGPLLFFFLYLEHASGDQLSGLPRLGLPWFQHQDASWENVSLRQVRMVGHLYLLQVPTCFTHLF